MTDNNRADPDLILAHLVKTEEQDQRGRLKIFFGSSAGVGKTYTMLEVAHEHSTQNLDVLVGIVETHKRPETEKMLEGLSVLPPYEINYRGLTLQELDLDAALKCKPDILLVDELAHSNAPGTRHPKRWNDVIELLDAGIDVYTTLNVQHIESLSDLIASSTGVWVKETIPDTVFDLADDVVLVDIDEDDLIQRLHEGKVYLAPGAMTRAAENFFKKSNLGALREIALRRTADRVDALRTTENQQDPKSTVSDKILVCIAADTMAHTLARTGKRLATSLKAPWEALHIERPQLTSTESRNNKFIAQTERTIERMGGKMTTIAAHDIVDEIINYAKINGFTKIIIGKDPRNNLRSFLSMFIVNRLIRRSGGIDVYVVTASNDPLPDEQEKKICWGCWKKHLLTLLISAVLTLPSLITTNIFNPTDQALIYLIGIVIVADKLGFLSSLFYMLIAACSFHFFILEPHYSYLLHDKSYLISFFLMLMTSYIIATQAARLRAQTMVARQQSKQSQDLLSLTRALTSTHGRFALAKTVEEHIKSSLGGDSTIWMINSEGHPSVILGDIPQATYYKDFGALVWCLENNQMAGHDTETLPSAYGTYLPLTTDQGVIGVIGYLPVDVNAPVSRSGIELLEALASLLAGALARVKAGEKENDLLLQDSKKESKDSFIEKIAAQLEKNIPNKPIDDRPSVLLEPRVLSEILGVLNNAEGSIKPSFDHGRKKNEREIPSQEMSAHPIAVTELIERARKVIDSQDKSISLAIEIPSNTPDVMVDTSMMTKAFTIILHDAAEKILFGLPLNITAERGEDDVRLNIILPVCPFTRYKQDNSLNILEDLTNDILTQQNIVETNVATGIIHLNGGTSGIEETADGKTRYYITLPIA